MLGDIITPAGETLTSATLEVVLQSVYSDSNNTYPTEYKAEYDDVNHRWMPLGGTAGDFFYLPGPNGAEPEGPLTKFSETQVYESGWQQTFNFWRYLVGDAGNWYYATPDTDAVYVSGATGIPSGVATWANVKHPNFGALGDGTTDDLAAISAALASISSGGDLYFPPGEYLISDNLTLPATVECHFDALSKIKIASGKVLTLQSQIDARSFQIFSGTGTVAIGSANPQKGFDVRWWGATGNNSTDELASFQSLINAIGGLHRTIDVPPGNYVLSDDIEFPLNVTVRPAFGAYLQPATLKGVIFTGPVDKGQWNIEGGTGTFSYAIYPPAPAMVPYAVSQSDGGHNWDADLDTRSGATYKTVTIPTTVAKNTEPMVFNSTLGILMPTVHYTRTNSVFVFLDGAQPLYDGTYAETIYIWSVVDGGA